MLEAVIFDMDGVIVDTEPIYDQHRMGYAKRQFDREIDKTFMDKARGLSSRSFWEKFSAEFAVTLSIDEVIEHSRIDYLEFLKNHPDLKPVDGVLDLIDELGKAAIPMAVASSASLRRINFMMELLHIEDVIKTRVCSDDVINGKPAPDIYLKAAQLLGVVPESCLVIEDATNGVKAAKNADMKVVAYAGSPHNTQDLSEADKIINSFKEIDLGELEKLFI